jgi:NADPH2:quinone reductase
VKNTFHQTIESLQTRGMMVSFGNASGSLENIDVKKSIQPKGLYFTRPSMWHYLNSQNELQEGANKLFEKIKLGKIKIEIFKKYRLDDVIQAHKDLESRKITGPAIIIP